MGPAPVSLEKDLRTGMILKSGGKTAADEAARFDGQAPLVKRFQVLSSLGAMP